MNLPRILGTAIVLIAICVSPVAALELESLAPDQSVHGFKALNVYENGSGKVVGARFISEKYGFVTDVVQIESVPQAFYWIKTPPTSSKGEPHACEHLLLGKGNRGRYVAALEDMSLGNSTAFTAQTWTCYHFNTTAGEKTFYEIFEAKLQAFLRPDFTDEEIRREVCHIGVVEDPQDGSLAIDEKGTVYTEMVSSFERPWSHTYDVISRMVYGDSHPLTYNSGGDPDVMRSMTAEDMWTFHKSTHHLANMGAIVSIPGDIPVDQFLQNLNGILERSQDFEDSSPTPGIGNFDFPAPDPAPTGTTQLVTYPSEKPEDPGYLIYAYPSDLELDYLEQDALELFLTTFGRGQTSDLYNLFINSQTRIIDLGGNAVDAWLEDPLGSSIWFDLTGINNTYVNETMLDSVQALILAAVKRVRDYPDGSDELREFNTRARNRVIERKKYTENSLNQPPMFGFRRGPAGRWLGMMRNLEEEDGFRKSLVSARRFAYLDSLLSLEHNIWRERIDGWRLLTLEPYQLGASPGMDYLERQTAAKSARLTEYVEDFKEHYAVEDEQEAIAAYKLEFDATTAELEALASDDQLPGFVDQPPMTLDDQLNYETIELANGIPMVASTFENMTSSRVGLALKMDVVPESLLVYVPFIPSVLTNIGVIKDGEVVTFDEMRERLRQEVLSLNAYFVFGFQRDRVELQIRGEGSNLEELENALGWMNAALYSPYLSTDNLPRMIDIIDQSLLGFRNRMKGSEEGWVNIPANAYHYQENPLLLSSYCFLTQVHHMQRLKWQLTDPGDEGSQKQLAAFIETLKTTGQGLSREDLSGRLTGLEEFMAAPGGEADSDVKRALSELDEAARPIAADIIKELKVTLTDIPDANLSGDWAYLCDEISADLMIAPATAIARINGILDLVRKSDNARTFMISNSENRTAALPAINALVGRLDSASPSVRQTYAPTRRITERLASREPGVERPIYVGLMHEGTRNGVLVFSAEIGREYDTNPESVLHCLAGKLYSGGGPHSLFMKTWAAGLAYSNGYRINQATGRARYYAERCPDVAETMSFVVDQLKSAEDNPALTDYSIAMVFGLSRAPDRYESRGEAMATDLVDGFTPDKVRAYRQKVLDMKNRENLYEELKGRMETAYGPVLIGYGEPLAASNNATFFLIGPEPQFESLENLIESAEGKQTVHRLYRRDFWLTM